jgi:cytochrome oxidase Cu insertion factor (SCO1/SenC/PrrC family)
MNAEQPVGMETSPPAPRKMAPGTIIALLMILAGLGTAISIYVRRVDMAEAERARAQKAKTVEDIKKFGEEPVGDFSLTESSGKTVTAESLRGRVWVAETGFTYCGAVCPRMNEVFAKLHREFDGKDEPKFVMISVDPTRDTPSALKDYARMYQADPDRWWFLTGDPKQIQQATRAILLPYQPGVPATHSEKFVLIDRDGWIRGFYRHGDGTEVDELRRDLRLLLEQPVKKN